MGSIETLAPGKVILHGEHAVVYGTKAIAVSVGLYTKVTIFPHDKLSVSFSDIGIHGDFNLKEIKLLKSQLGDQFTYDNLMSSDPIELDISVVRKIADFVKLHDVLEDCSPELKPAQTAALEAFIFLYLAINPSVTPQSIVIDTELPVGAGLGSSASFGVALAGALLVASGHLDKNNVDLNLVNRWAFVSERFVHGTPSGIDNSVVTYGRAIIFQKGQSLEHENCDGIRVLLVNTAVPRSTKELVAKVRTLHDNDNPLFSKLIDGVTEIVEECIRTIKTTGTTTADLVTRNQEVLQKFGVSHPRLDEIVNISKENGFGAKLTGAGGGGCAFVIIPKDTEEVFIENLKHILKEKNYQFWDTVLGCKGFQVM